MAKSRIAGGLFFAIASVLCLFAQKRVLDYFLQATIRQLDFVRSTPWFLAAVGSLAIILGISGMLKPGNYSGPTWAPVVTILVGVSMILGHKFMAQYQYDLYYRLYIHRTGGNVSWRPLVVWYTYAVGVILGLVSFVIVYTGIYSLRH